MTVVREGGSRVSRPLLVVIGFVLAALALPSAAQAYTCGTAGADNFQQGQSTTNLGPNWIERKEDWFISAGGRAFHASNAEGIATFNGAAARNVSVCVDVNRGTAAAGLRLAGVAVGYKSLTDANFIYVSSTEDSNKFNGYRFKSNGVVGEGPGQGTIETPFDNARLHVTQIGPVATLEIDLNYDGIAEETYSADYEDFSGTGTGVGIYSYANAGIDNFSWGPILPPGSPGGGLGGGGGSSPTTDATKPTLGSLRFSSTTFKAAKSGASTSAKKRKPKRKVGTKVSFNLSEPSGVKFTVQRKTSGRRISGKCKTRSRKNRSKPKCTLWKNVTGSFTVRGKTGTNSFTFRGRIGRKSLKAGSYRLNGQASDTAKNKSAIKTKAFKIVK